MYIHKIKVFVFAESKSLEGQTFVNTIHVNHGATSKSIPKLVLQLRHNNIRSQQRLSVQAGEESCGAKADVVRLQQINIHNHNTFRHSTAGLTCSPLLKFDQNVSLASRWSQWQPWHLGCPLIRAPGGRWRG